MSFGEIDRLWLLVCAVLVFLMQAGFLCLEAGLTRSKNAINVAFKNFSDFGVAILLFWAVGFGLVFGTQWLGLTGGDILSDPSGKGLIAFFLFQAMFCGTTVTLLSGAVAERMRFRAYLVFSLLVSAGFYPLIAWSAWGDALGGPAGFFQRMGFVDFAGVMVVHGLGGWIALGALIIVGARHGRFGKDGEVNRIPASQMPLAVLGVLLLWIGWIGFNGGSTLSYSDEAAVVIGRTMLAGCSGLVIGILLGRLRYGYHEPMSILNGSLAGLVAITGCAHVVGSAQAVLIGAVGSVISMVASREMERWRLDDPVGVVPVHLAAGAWGTLAVGLFGNLALLGTGLSRWEQVAVQAGCFLATGLVTVPIVIAISVMLKRVGWLRIGIADEEAGMNVSEHRTTSEISDLINVMDHHRKTQVFTLRAPEEPFTLVGQIAKGYNRLVSRLEDTQVDLDSLRISEQKLNEQQAKLREQAFTDPLTALKNRAGFHEAINQMMQATRRNARLKLCLVFMDLDKFKIINDGMGHEVGDKLLVAVAQRIKRFIQELPPPACWSIQHSASRLGGDEFALLLASPASEQEAIRWCETLRELLNQPIELEHTTLTISTSMGLAMQSASHYEPSDLVRDADTAMYVSKRNGRNCVTLFDANMREQSELRLALTQELREALHNDEFKVHYQPLVNGATGQISGFEALLRWEHSRRGMISPADFIPIAEETGVIKQIGRWLLRRCIHQLSQWQQLFSDREEPINLSINLSRRELTDPDLVEYILDLTRQHGVDPSTVHLEITEGTVMFDPHVSKQTLSKIRKAGFKISIDDFGTGYSSLASLYDIPFDTLKIDRMFLGEASSNVVKSAVLEHIISIAHAFGARVVAEGVEVIEHVDMLREMNCDTLQGFFYSRALPRDQAEQLLSNPHQIVDKTTKPMKSAS